MADTEGNEEVFEVLNDYTLSVTNDFQRGGDSDPELRRIFNFRARQITNVFSMWYGEGMSTNMQIQKFSELDSLDEVREMHRMLCNKGGNPPSMEDILNPISKPKTLNL